MQNSLLQMNLDARISGIITRTIDLPFRFYMLDDPSDADFRHPAFLPIWDNGTNEIFGMWVASVSPISFAYVRSVREESTIELVATTAEQFIAWIAVYAVDIGESREPVTKFLTACSAQVGFDEIESVSCGDRDFSRLLPYRDGTLNPEHPPLLNEPRENARELFYSAVREHDVEAAWKLLNVSGWWDIDELKLAFDAFRRAFPNLTSIEPIHRSWLASIDAYLAL
jgi:hypothetical protein